MEEKTFDASTFRFDDEEEKTFDASTFRFDDEDEVEPLNGDEPQGRPQGDSPIPLTAEKEAAAKGELGITETAQKDYEAATGADAPENPILAQIANMGLMAGGRLNANLQMQAAQKLAAGGNYDDRDVDDLMDQMVYGGVKKVVNALKAAPFMAGSGMGIAPSFPRTPVRFPNEIMRDWDKSEGRRYSDPEERRIARMEYARQIASDFIRERSAVRQNAETELQNRDVTHTANIVSRGLGMVGYSAPYMLGPVGIGLQFLEEGSANAVGYANDEYGYDENGRFRIVAKGDDAGRAALAGFGTAGVETTSELVGGKIGGALAKRGGKALGRLVVGNKAAKAIGAGVGKLAGKTAEALGKTKAGRATLAFAKGVGSVFKWTSRKMHLENPIEENIEEFESQLANSILGWDKRKSELENLTDEDGNPIDGVAARWWHDTKQFLKPGELLKLNEAMLLTMGGGAAVAHFANRAARKDVDNIIRRHDLMSEEEIKTASLEDKVNAFKAWAAGLNEDETARMIDEGTGAVDLLAERIAGSYKKNRRRVNALREKMAERDDYNNGVELDRLKIPHQKFNIPMRQDARGRNVPDFRTVITADVETGETAQRNAVYDESGISIVDNGAEGDAAYSVFSPDGRTSRDFPTLTQAVNAATRLKNAYALDLARDRMKQEFIENEYNANYRGAKNRIVDVKGVEEAVRLGVKLTGEDVSKDANFRRDRRGWRLKDGTVVLVRDNIASPAEAKRLMRHEIVGHDGRMMQGRWFGSDAESEIGRLRDANLARTLKDGPVPERETRRVLRETVANVVQRRRHSADAIDKVVHAVRNALRDRGVDLKMNDTDLEVEVSRIEKELRRGDGETLVSIDGTVEKQEFREAGQAEKKTEERKEEADETGNVRDEAQPQPEQGTAEPAGGEAARPAEAQPQGGEAPRQGPVEAAKPDAEAAEKPTEAPPPPKKEHDFLRVMHADREPVRVPVGEIALPDTQFKEGADPKTGVVKGQELKGEYFESAENAVVVYERRDGTRELVTGRHRLDLAKRTGKKDILARVFRESDGYTPEDMRNLDAISNIIDEKGTEHDYIRYFDSARPSRAAAESAGFLSRSKGRLAFELFEGASEDTRSAIDWSGSGADGLISPEQAGIIAKAAPVGAHPRNEAVQRILVKKAQDGLRGDRLAIVARSLAEEAKRRKAPATGGETQLDLFTSEEDQRLLALEEKRAARRVQKANEYGRVASVLQTAMQKGGRLDLNRAYAKELGIKNPKDRKQLADARQKALERADYWRNAVRLEDADRAALDAELGIAPKGNLELESVTGDQIAEENRKRREREEIERRRNAPMKGGAGEVGQSLMDLGGAEGEDLFNRTQRPEPAAAKPETPARPAQGAQAPAPKAETAVFTNKDGTKEPVEGYAVPREGDIAPDREVVVQHDTGGMINARQKIRGAVKSITGDRVAVDYKDGWGYEQSDTFDRSEIIGVKPLPQTRENGPAGAPKEAEATTPPKAAKPAEGRKSGDAAVVKENLTTGKPASGVGVYGKRIAAGRMTHDEVMAALDKNPKMRERLIKSSMGVQMRHNRILHRMGIDIDETSMSENDQKKFRELYKAAFPDRITAFESDEVAKATAALEKFVEEHTAGNTERATARARAVAIDGKNESEVEKVVDFVDAIENGNESEVSKSKGRHFRLAKTSGTLKECGLTGEFFTIRTGVILRHRGKDAEHTITAAEWVDISEALTERKPQLVEKYGKDGKSYRIWTEAKIGGKTAIVGVDVKSVGRDMEVNSISTAFGASGAVPKEENIVYPKTKKEIQSVPTRHNSGRYPESPSTANSIAQSAANVKGLALESATPEDVAKVMADRFNEVHAKDKGYRTYTPKDFLSGAATLLKNIREKNADGLISVVANGLNPASLRAFEVLTGVKMPRAQRDQRAAIDRYCGITPERRAQMDAESAARAKEKEEAERRADALAEGRRLAEKKVQLPGEGLVSLQELLERGWTVQRVKRGAAYNVRLVDPKTGRFFRIGGSKGIDGRILPYAEDFAAKRAAEAAKPSAAKPAPKGADTGRDARKVAGTDYTVARARELLREDVEARIADVAEEMGVELRVVGVDLHGSRVRGDARPDSDLDLVVEYEGDASEDALFDALNEKPIDFHGIRVDVNPIRADKTGTLAEYMKRSAEYDREKTAEKKPAPKPKKTKEPSVRMKDEAAERKAKAALDAIDFDTPELGENSTIVSGDEVRKTMPGYNRLDWSTHVDRTGYVGPKLEAQFLRLLKERKGKGNGRVVFLAGGNGAGKSTVAARLGGTPDFTIDSTLGNLEVAKRQIDAILANGQTPVIHFVYRTPGQALEGIAQRVRNGGHIVSPLSFANSHVKSRENLRLLSDAYGDKIHVHIYDNSVEGAPEITLEQLEAKGKPDHARIRESANYYLGHLRNGEEGGRHSEGGVAGGGAKGARGQVDFDTPEFDPEKFGKLVTGVGRLVDVLVESGHRDFKALATYIYERDAAKYGRAKPVLRNVWNQIADLRGLDEVSRKDAERVFGIIEAQNKEAENGLREPGNADHAGGAAPSGVPSEGGDRKAESGDAVQGNAGNGEAGADAAVRDGGEGGQGVHVERPEMADGALPAGGAEHVREGDAGGPQVPVGGGQHVAAEGPGAERGEPVGELEPVEPRIVGGVDGGATAVATAQAQVAADLPNTVKSSNYVITDADERAIENGTPLGKFRQNVRAIRIVRKLAEEGREATADEKVELARYVGWGGLKDAFNGQYGKAYEEERSAGEITPQRRALVRKTPLGEEGYGLYREMREVLTDEELKFADASTSSAFYTPIRLCRSIHNALAKAGLKGGRLLETSAGVGNLIGTGGYSSPRWTAVEYDRVSGQILKALYPRANVRIQGFEDVAMPDNFYDAAISNVPFGDSHPFDPNYKKYGFVIHDFFFAKGVDKVHPGGVVAFVTSTGTLDKADKKLIRYLSEHGGKIVGAVRMPNGTFAKNAGTDVATDVIFIQKVEGAADNSGFLKTGTEMGCPISQYFVEHPDMCLGEKVAGSDQWGRPKLRYRDNGVSMGDVDAAIQRAASALKFKSANDSRKPSQIADMIDSNGLANGNVGVVGGRIVRRIDGELAEVPKRDIPGLTAPLLKKGVTPQQVVRDLGALRDAQRKVIDAQLANCTDEELKGLQGLLGAEYDRFVKRYGNLHQPMPKKFIDLDYAASSIILGLEAETKFQDGVDGRGRPKARSVYSKADIFTKRTIFASPKATTAANALDGLRISLNETGAVDTARIAELTGKPEGDVRRELIDSGRVFVNPETSGIETRDEYLSGSVRRKLKAARAAAEIDEAFKRNVDELLKVQPDDIAATDISYQLGQNWIPKDVYEQFIREAVYQGTAPRAKVTFDPVEHLWHVDDAHGRTEWDDESGLAVDDLLERMMNGRSIVVRRKVGDNEYAVDTEATTATKIVQEKVARAFQSWMTDDLERANRVERIYNDVMNDSVERKFDTDILEFHGLSEDWAGRVNTRGREYQKKCIARGTFAGNLLIAHCVGAGKTFEMASICMQLRRLGIARKPMFAVPNHMLAQWDKEFHEAYPGAKVLVAGRKDLSRDRRRAFLAKVANGDWDCVIVAHSSFSRIAMSPEHQAEYIEAEIADLEDVLANTESKKEREKIKKLIQSRRDRLKALLDPSRKDDSIRFEELGCDYLFVDEAHNFKGLQISTHMSNVPGVTGSVSQRAQDLEMKCRYIAKLHGGDKGVVFATGTPISNSISEMYVMMRYLAPTKMDDMGVKGFDDWAKQFGQVVNEWSPNPSGVGFREKARFSQFQNVPEMKRFFRSFADIVLDGDLDIRRPKPKEVKHVLKPSAAQRAYVASLNRRMERMQGTKVDPSEDNMLKVTTEGRLLAIDPMLIGVKDESHARANACADEVKRVYDQSTGKVVKDRDGKDVAINGTQLIFCDSGVPKERQFKQLVRTGDGNYEVASGKYLLRVYKPDAYGSRMYEICRGDTGEVLWRPNVNVGTLENPRMEVRGIADHSVEGREDLASVYTALESMRNTLSLWKRGDAVGNRVHDSSRWGKPRKPQGTPVDINGWLDLNSDAVGYDPRFQNPYAAEQNAEAEPEAGESESADAADDRDTSTEANGDVEVDNMLRGKFNMYAEIRRQLIRRGIPAEEIAFIHDAETMTQKQALFDKVKKGEIRVLIGNTAKMGEGTNVQDMLVAIHHLDIPWKPAWITQRDGRGIRSGNMNDEVEIHKYITEGTFDVYSWDTVGRKAKFIENAMNARMDQRVIEDADSTVMSLEEGKAAAAGDPRILERVKLIKAIEKMQMEFDTQVKALDRAKMRYRVAERELADAEKFTAEYTGAIRKFNEAKGGRPFTFTTIEDSPRELTDNAEVAREIQDRLGFFARKGSDVGLVGRVFGFDLRYERDGSNARIMIKELYVDAPVTIIPGVGASFPPADLSMLKAKITSHTGERERQGQEHYLDDRRRRLDVARKGVENAEGFDRDAAEDEIGKSRLALARLNKALGIKDNNVKNLAKAYADSKGLVPGTPETDFDSPELDGLKTKIRNGTILTEADQRQLAEDVRSGRLRYPRFTADEIAASTGKEHGRLWQYILSLESARMDGRRARGGSEVHGRAASQVRRGGSEWGRVGTGSTQSPSVAYSPKYRKLDSGTESEVFDEGDGWVIKVRQIHPLSIGDVIDELAKIVYHNYLFPGERYALDDIIRHEHDGYREFYLVLRQPFVTPKTENGRIVQPTYGQIWQLMKSRPQGFTFMDLSSRPAEAGEYGDYSSSDGDDGDAVPAVKKVAYNGQFVVYDFQPGRNTFIDAKTGKVRFIDPRIDINDPGAGFQYSKHGTRSKFDGDVDFDTPELYTGSAADYERPSLHAVGTGEGSQVYGWGLYASNRRGVAEGYAKRIKDAASVSALYKGRTVDENADADTHSIASAVKYVAQYPNEASTVEEYFDKQIAAYERKGALYKQFADGTRRLLRRYLSEKTDWSVSLPQEHLYEQTWFTDRAPGDESHLLNWYEPVGEAQLKWIEDGAKNAGLDVGYNIRGELYIAHPMSDRRSAVGENGIHPMYWQTGQDAYESFARFFGSPKAASEFLARAGIDGVKYPVDSYGGKTLKDGDAAGWNYVSFRDDNIRVDHKWRDGEILFDTPELDPGRRAEEVNTYARRYYERHRALRALNSPTPESVMDAAEGRWHRFRRAIQDKNLVIREVEERLGVTDKKRSVYYAKDREFGLNEHQLGELQKRHVEPIFDALAKTGVGQEAFDLYLIARHAPYRNALVMGRDGKENGSGMSDADAARIIEKFRALGVEGDLSRIADMVYAMNDEALQRLVDSGRLSQEDADGFRAAQADYVPLRTDMEDADRDVFNSSTSGWKKNEFHAARGRETLADSPLAWSVVQAERAIKASNANVTRQAAAALVRHAEKIGKPIGEIIPAHRFQKRWAFDVGGEVWTADALQDRPDVIFFKEGGKLKAIRVDGGRNALGITFAKAVTDKDLVQFSKWFEWVPKLTRAMAAMRTQYVPTFILRNMKADTLEALLNAFSERGLRPGASFAKRLVANEWKNRKDVRAYFRTGEARGWMKEFVENGGLTGGGMAAEGFSEAARRVQRTLKSAGGGRARKLAAAIPDAISLLNACAEYSTRLGIYSTLRQEGVGIEDAISYARDATVNFNRKGYLTPYTNAAFMFSNAAIQGMGRAFRSIGSEYGKGTLAALFLVGVIQALLDHWLGDDDDREEEGLSNARNMTEHAKQTTLGVPLQGGRRLTTQIRNPWALPMYAGRKTVELVMGMADAWETAKDMASALGGFATEPVGGNGFDSMAQTWQTFAPTLADPLVQWMTGKDFKGDDRLRRKWDENLPDSWNGKRNTADPYKWVAQGLNAVSGGGQFRKGAFDTSPENWQLLAETVMGGALTDLNRVTSTVVDAWDALHGAPPDQVLRDIPFVRDTLTNMPDVSNRFYRRFDAYKADRTEYRGVTGADERLAFVARHPWVENDRARELEREITELGKMEQGLEKKDGQWVATERTPKEQLAFRRQRLAKMAEFVRIMETKPSDAVPPEAEYRIVSAAFAEAAREYDKVRTDPLVDGKYRNVLLAEMRQTHPLLESGVRGRVSALVSQVNGNERLLKDLRKKGASDARIRDLETRIGNGKAEVMRIMRQNR